MALYTEAHLPAEKRTSSVVRYVRGKRRSLIGWLLLVVFIILNEMRGVYVVVEFLKAYAAA